eukprot:COSAG01_NODE_68522_length_264_cov_0.466667_1_plen_44_part_01
MGCLGWVTFKGTLARWRKGGGAFGRGGGAAARTGGAMPTPHVVA